ncbi:hypothetical protein QOZ80_5BG0450570 [Eleusine coracana subsp. coracana]|nr:hypothetical protein QOZ80_5BG0450570 [Eleusine coracana subsp. coracana]
MRWLELEIKLAAGTVLALPSPARFVTASGNDESCGPAFSGLASTVMASVDRRPLTAIPPVLPWPAPKAAARKEEEEDEDDYEEGDYEWAMQLLNDGPGAEVLSGSQ